MCCELPRSDASGADAKVSGYSWMFVDRKGYPVAPSLIAKSFEKGADGSLQLSVIQPSAIADGVRGRSRVAVEHEGGAGPHYYESPWFIFKSPSEGEVGTTDGPSGIPDEQGTINYISVSHKRSLGKTARSTFEAIE